MLPPLPAAWQPALAAETQQPYFRALDAFLDAERAAGHEVLPRPAEIFAALDLTPPERVKVVLLGQDPYPTPGHAHGLCFSVRRDVRPLPRSLRNIYRELAADIPDFRAPTHGNLESWARQGVLLLNPILTVRAGEANAHRQRGWERFTDAVIRAVNEQEKPVVFILWGSYAQKKAAFVDTSRHLVIKSPHPSPLSAHNGFFGSRPFSRANAFLVSKGYPPIDWRLPDAADAAR